MIELCDMKVHEPSGITSADLSLAISLAFITYIALVMVYFDTIDSVLNCCGARTLCNIGAPETRNASNAVVKNVIYMFSCSSNLFFLE